MGREDGLIDMIDMLLQILDLLEILLGQTVACGIRDIHNGGTSLDHCLHHLGEIRIVGATCILTIELHIIDEALGILRGSHSTLQNLLTGGVELVLDVFVAGADTCVDTLVLGILQRLEGHIDVAFHSTCQGTDDGPCDGFRDFNHGVEVARRRNRESCFDHIHAELFKCFCHLNLLYGVQLAAGHLFTVAKRCVENKQSVTHNSKKIKAFHTRK